MKIAVLCANGKAGQLIVKEAVERGQDVTVFVRGENKTNAGKAVIKDIFDITKEDLLEFDVIINAFGVWYENAAPAYVKVMNHLCTLLKGSNKRFVIVGGAGSLYMDKSHTKCLLDMPDFPEIYKNVAQAGLEYLNTVRLYNDVNWTFISPAADFRADGEKKGSYKLCGEEFTVNNKGESAISYADYAKALIDEVLSSTPHVRERISVIWN